MLKSEKVATPDTAGTVLVPERAPPPGLVPIATVMLPKKLVTVLPSASCAVTCSADLIGTPAVVVVGWTVKMSLVAGAGMMSKDGLVIVETSEERRVGKE